MDYFAGWRFKNVWGHLYFDGLQHRGRRIIVRIWISIQGNFLWGQKGYIRVIDLLFSSVFNVIELFYFSNYDDQTTFMNQWTTDMQSGCTFVFQWCKEGQCVYDPEAPVKKGETITNIFVTVSRKNLFFLVSIIERCSVIG